MNELQPSKPENDMTAAERIKAAVREMDRAHRMIKYLLGNVGRLVKESERSGRDVEWEELTRHRVMEESIRLATSQSTGYFRMLGEIRRTAAAHMEASSGGKK
jgi:hypothetical protein